MARGMSEDMIKKIQELIEKGNGDTERLNKILNSLQNGETLDFSDQQYIDSLVPKTNELETKEDSNLSNISEDAGMPPKLNRKKIIIAGIVIAAIFFGYLGANAYAVSALQFRPHQGTQYSLSETMLHIQAEACNPSFFPASFHDYEIDAVYKSQVLETALIMGNTISPKSSSLLDGTFTINKEALAQVAQLGPQFDPNEATVKTKLDASLFGIIPFTINKDYSGTEFSDIVKNGPPGGYKC